MPSIRSPRPSAPSTPSVSRTARPPVIIPTGKALSGRSKKQAKLSVQGKRVLLLGCGGAARAIAMTLAFRGVEKIFISNRTVAKAEALAAEINSKLRNCAEALTPTPERLAEIITGCDFLVNSTSLGMRPREEEMPLAPELLADHLVVADIVYNPLKTRLLKTAEARGCRIVEGLGMLIYQGAAAFKLWTGIDPPIPEMTEAAYAMVPAGRG